MGRRGRQRRVVTTAIAVAGALTASLWVRGADPAAQNGTGTIRGVVRTRVKPADKPISVSTDQAVCGTTLPDESIRVGAAGTVANAVLVVIGTTGGPAPDEPVVANRRCSFAPRVQVARPRTSVTLTSEDALLHNTHAYDEQDHSLFNIALPSPSLKVKRALRGPGIVTIKCDVHPWMRGFMIVTDELAAVSDALGRFELTGVPAGTREVRVWHETLKAAPVSVTVRAGAVAELDVTLGR